MNKTSLMSCPWAILIATNTLNHMRKTHNLPMWLESDNHILLCENTQPDFSFKQGLHGFPPIWQGMQYQKNEQVDFL